MTTTANPTPEALRNGSTRTARLLIRPWKHEDAADAFVTRSFPECYTQTSARWKNLNHVHTVIQSGLDRTDCANCSIELLPASEAADPTQQEKDLAGLPLCVPHKDSSFFDTSTEDDAAGDAAPSSSDVMNPNAADTKPVGEEYDEKEPGIGPDGKPRKMQVIGFIGAVRGPEIGYMIHPALWGKGYASEALKGYLDLFFEKWTETQHAAAVIDPQNPASAKVLERAGFKVVEITKQDFQNHWLGQRDSAWYRIDRKDWEERKKSG